MNRAYFVFVLMVVTFVPQRICRANPTADSSGLHIELKAIPGQIGTGKQTLYYSITNSAGSAVSGAHVVSLTKMRSMSMGEQQVTAVEVPGHPGLYSAPAQLSMEGDYESSLTITLANAATPITAAIHISTGQIIDEPLLGNQNAVSNESANSGKPTLILPLALLLTGAWVLFRVIKSGQKIDYRAVTTPSTVGSLILICCIVSAAVYAVGKYRRPGSMTPMEAQGMKMELPAPPGTAPVQVVAVRSGEIESTITVSGQAVGMNEQEIYPRIQGNVVWLGLYAGDHVKQGQLIARLDSSQTGPQVRSQAAGLLMAQQGVAVATKEYQQTMAAITEAHAEVGMKQGTVESAKAATASAAADRRAAEAELEAAKSMRADADAAKLSAAADADYWKAEIERERELLSRGAVTREEYQRELSQSISADARVRQADAKRVQVEAQIRSAQAGLEKADALIQAAQSNQKVAQSELDSHFAHVSSSQAIADSAKQKILLARAGTEQSRAMLDSAKVQQGYTEIHSPISGVVVQRLTSPGALVNPGQGLLSIAEISRIRVQVSVSESDLANIHVGTSVTISNDAGASVTAAVSSVSPAVDPVSRMGLVEAIIDNHNESIVPGQYLRMKIAEHSALKALLVPTNALRYRSIPIGNAPGQNRRITTIWIAEQDGANNTDPKHFTAHEVQVVTGAADSTRTAIKSGLKPGQFAIVAGQDYLREGDSVSPQGAQQ